VEELFEAYARRSGSVAPPAPRAAEPDGDPLAATRQALRMLAGVASGPSLRAHLAALAVLDGAAQAGDALLSADQAQALAYLGALPRPAQRALALATALQVGPRRGVPRSAHRAPLRAALGEAARRAGALPRPSDLP
jgi:hypothetical protein